MDISERIRNRRKEIGMSQQELADKTGYQSGSAINKIEKGQRDISVSKIPSFAAALGVSVFWLMGMKPKEKSKFDRLCEDLSDEQKERVAKYIEFILWSDSYGSI